MESQSIYPHSATLFAAICACLFIVVGIFGNLITMFALMRSPKIRCHATTAFVLSLCISDLLFCSFSLPLTAVRFFKERWTFGETLCKIFPVIFYGNVAVSLLSMVCITINRYILIACHNLYANIYKTKFIAIQLIFVWAVSFLLLLPAVLGIWGEMGLDEVTFSCTILKKNGKSIKKTLFLIGFLLPCLVIIISYTCIYVKVLKQKKRMTNHRQYVVSTKENIFNARKSREDNRLTLMMVMIFVCFLVCFLPLMLANVVDDERNTSYPWLHIVASVMAWASSVINPIIYAASNRNYRIAYIKVFSNLKFWGEPMSPMPSKSFQASKNSKDFSAAVRSTPLFQTTKLKNFNEGCENYSI
ncbi:protein trapped in endoderm-1 isoform X1 [Lucilia sericata]|uniref:protein trapped in endoderm-1 isoform X1 n=2 Tax=Lucilia sericata TaxID=13632 RepID=UPI0018A878B2|nr:protein trapped in endoderm-1 isoform X1 [Lucilia sericata]XP_037808575.1 protein trapped in endoderm-1 isoform X1 [Lucilia sericata]